MIRHLSNPPHPHLSRSSLTYQYTLSHSHTFSIITHNLCPTKLLSHTHSISHFTNTHISAPSSFVSSTTRHTHTHPPIHPLSHTHCHKHPLKDRSLLPQQTDEANTSYKHQAMKSHRPSIFPLCVFHLYCKQDFNGGCLGP